MAEPRRPMLFFSQLKERGMILSRRQVDRLEAEGKFPRRVPLSERRVGWVAGEIDQWVTDKIASRSLDAGELGSGIKPPIKRRPSGGPSA